MPHIPRIEKFRGDNKQSFDAWIKLFEAQAQVLDIQADLRKQTSSCSLQRCEKYT